MYSIESPHWGSFNEYNQHTIIVYIEKTFLNYCHLLPYLAPWFTLSGSNYPYLEQVSMVPKMFEPLKLDCMFLRRNKKKNVCLDTFLSRTGITQLKLWYVLGIAAQILMCFEWCSSNIGMFWMLQLKCWCVWVMLLKYWCVLSDAAQTLLCFGCCSSNICFGRCSSNTGIFWMLPLKH